MATRATLRARILRIRQDEAGLYDTPAHVNDLLNQADAQFLRDTRLRRETYVGDLPAGTVAADLSTIAPAVLEVLRVWVDDRELQYVTGDQLACLPGYPTETGTPRYCCREVSGFPAVRLHPIPAGDFNAVVVSGLFATGPYGITAGFRGLSAAEATSAYGLTAGLSVMGGGLRIEYVAAATPMTDDGDEPSTPEAFQGALVWWVLARLHEDDVPISQQAMAPGYWAKYAAAVDACSRLVKAGFQRKPAGSRRQSRTEWY